MWCLENLIMQFMSNEVSAESSSACDSSECSLQLRWTAVLSFSLEGKTHRKLHAHEFRHYAKRSTQWWHHYSERFLEKIEDI